MSILETLGTAGASILSGGLTGILTAGLQRYADYKNKQLDITANREKYSHEIDMRKADAEIMAQEWAGKTKVAEIEAQGVVEAADSAAFDKSITEPMGHVQPFQPTPNQAYAVVVLDFIRGIVRPGLTVYLCILTTLIYFHAQALLKNAPLSVTEAVDLTKLVIATILYLTTTCVLHYFGTRNKQKPPGVI